MTYKLTICLGAVLLFVPLLTADPIGAEGQCAKLLNNVCLDCHNQDKFCERLGASEKQWRSLLKWMIANGADLGADDVDLLAACLSKPADEAKDTCGK